MSGGKILLADYNCFKQRLEKGGCGSVIWLEIIISGSGRL